MEALLGIAWAISFLEITDCTLMHAISAALIARGHMLDQGADLAAGADRREACHLFGAGKQDGPALTLDLGNAYVMAKPPGWAVDSGAPGEQLAGPARNSFVAFLRSYFLESAIVRDEMHRYGVLHRLDANSSGLVLGALTFEAYYHLHFQLDTYQVGREYVCLVHDHVSPEIVLVNARVRRDEGHKSMVAADGKPAATRLKVLGHLHGNNGGRKQNYSLVALQLITGRSHQIRTHMQHIGHPVVCDAKYTSASVLAVDRQWCPRNFLHRYRLAFAKPGAGRGSADVIQQLPADLVAALGTLSPLDEASARALDVWLQSTDACRLPPRYDDLTRVQGLLGNLAEEAPWPPIGPSADGECDGLAWYIQRS